MQLVRDICAHSFHLPPTLKSKKDKTDDCDVSQRGLKDSQTMLPISVIVCILQRYFYTFLTKFKIIDTSINAAKTTNILPTFQNISGFLTKKQPLKMCLICVTNADMFGFHW